MPREALVKHGCMVLGTLAGLLLTSPALGVSATILLVAVNSSSLTTQELAKKALFEGWGYTVVAISASASQATFDSSTLTSSMAYIGSEVSSATLGTKLVSTTIPVVNEVRNQANQLGFSQSQANVNDTQINITNNSHYITSTFPTGNLTIFNSTQTLSALSGTQGSYTKLAERTSSASTVFAVLERGDAMWSGATAAGRRVFLPWGTNVDINQLNADGQTLLRRSIEWVLLPISHWKLDDGSGSTAVDWLGGRNGTRSGCTWTTGRIAGGLSLNGTTDYVSINDATASQVTNAMTIAGWVRAAAAWPNNTSWANVVLRKGDANPNNWQLCIWQTKVMLILDNNDDTGAVGNTSLAINTWYHVAGTWDGVNMRVYLNGVLDNTPLAKAAPIGTDTRAVYLGGRISSTDILNGTIDDVRFYNRALTAAEIAELAASTKPVMKTWQMVNPN